MEGGGRGGELTWCESFDAEGWDTGETGWGPWMLVGEREGVKSRDLGGKVCLLAYLSLQLPATPMVPVQRTIMLSLRADAVGAVWWG